MPRRTRVHRLPRLHCSGVEPEANSVGQNTLGRLDRAAYHEFFLPVSPAATAQSMISRSSGLVRNSSSRIRRPVSKVAASVTEIVLPHHEPAG
jgi:hypothetical protein